MLGDSNRSACRSISRSIADEASPSSSHRATSALQLSSPRPPIATSGHRRREEGPLRPCRGARLGPCRRTPRRRRRARTPRPDHRAQRSRRRRLSRAARRGRWYPRSWRPRRCRGLVRPHRRTLRHHRAGPRSRHRRRLYACNDDSRSRPYVPNDTATVVVRGGRQFVWTERENAMESDRAGQSASAGGIVGGASADLRSGAAGRRSRGGDVAGLGVGRGGTSDRTGRLTGRSSTASWNRRSTRCGWSVQPSRSSAPTGYCTQRRSVIAASRLGAQ